MTHLMDLVLAGSRTPEWIGLGLIAVAVAVLWWLAITRRPATPRRPRLVDDTAVMPVLRDQTEMIPRFRDGRRG